MKSSEWVVSVICLIIGVVLFAADFTKFVLSTGNTDVNIYPAPFFMFVAGFWASETLSKIKLLINQ
jgi:hypothetical protein